MDKEQLKELAAFVKAELAAGNEVNLPGLGKFVVGERAARTGRNPKTGEPVEIPAKKSVKFKASLAFKKELNG